MTEVVDFCCSVFCPLFLVSAASVMLSRWLYLFLSIFTYFYLFILACLSRRRHSNLKRLSLHLWSILKLKRTIKV